MLYAHIISFPETDFQLLGDEVKKIFSAPPRWHFVSVFSIRYYIDCRVMPHWVAGQVTATQGAKEKKRHTPRGFPDAFIYTPPVFHKPRIHNIICVRKSKSPPPQDSASWRVVANAVITDLTGFLSILLLSLSVSTKVWLRFIFSLI